MVVIKTPRILLLGVVSLGNFNDNWSLSRTCQARDDSGLASILSLTEPYTQHKGSMRNHLPSSRRHAYSVTGTRIRCAGVKQSADNNAAFIVVGGAKTLTEQPGIFKSALALGFWVLLPIFSAVLVLGSRGVLPHISSTTKASLPLAICALSFEIVTSAAILCTSPNMHA